MFAILQKNFGGRKTHRYFRDWNNAKAEMDKDIADCCKSLGGKVTKTYDYFNREKGFYVYEKVAHFTNREYCRWALLDGYFEDE